MRTGSLQNMIADGSKDAVVPEVGEGATLVRWTDRHAATVIEVSPSGHRIVVQRDRAIRTDGLGMTDAQTYRFERDPEGETEVATRRKDGSYRSKGGTGRVLIGVRSAYHDFSF